MATLMAIALAGCGGGDGAPGGIGTNGTNGVTATNGTNGSNGKDASTAVNVGSSTVAASTAISTAWGALAPRPASQRHQRDHRERAGLRVHRQGRCRQSCSRACRHGPERHGHGCRSDQHRIHAGEVGSGHHAFRNWKDGERRAEQMGRLSVWSHARQPLLKRRRRPPLLHAMPRRVRLGAAPTPPATTRAPWSTTGMAATGTLFIEASNRPPRLWPAWRTRPTACSRRPTGAT